MFQQIDYRNELCQNNYFSRCYFSRCYFRTSLSTIYSRRHISFRKLLLSASTDTTSDIIISEQSSLILLPEFIIVQSLLSTFGVISTEEIYNTIRYDKLFFYFIRSNVISEYIETDYVEVNLVEQKYFQIPLLMTVKM